MLYKHTYYVTDVKYFNHLWSTKRKFRGEGRRERGREESKWKNCIAQLKTNIKKENLILQQIRVLNSLC